jgi:type I restriction enzyme, R subunit
MKTNTTEDGLEKLVVDYMTSPGQGWIKGDPKNYNRDYAIDLAELTVFFKETQEDLVIDLELNEDSSNRQKFLARLQGEITKRGTVDVLRNGISHGKHETILFYATPSKGNKLAEEQHSKNRFIVTRQLAYSNDNTRLALDLGIFINGLPIATLELKNQLTKQNVDDAVEQYKQDRDHRDLLFQFGRCLVHFAVDDSEVEFCTHLKGKESWFLPFNKGWKHGAGNPPNKDGLKTDYLWKEVLERKSFVNIIEKYAQIIEESDKKSKKKVRKQVFPRYHQLRVVRKILNHVTENGVGQKYLIQHSAGSGKSNSIAWLAHQLVSSEHSNRKVFDSIIIVTDRRVLDSQIENTVKQFTHVKSIVGHAGKSGDLKNFLESGKKIIITTVQKFAVIVDEIGGAHRRSNFAIIIDEAHSSQSGRTSAKMNIALSANGAMEDDDTFEDQINKILEGRKMLNNASYFAFTATPKNKTLEIFGAPFEDGGVTKFRAFDNYTMKQAIQEGFIMDVLRNYTPVNSFYRLLKKIEDDPEFDASKAQKKLKRYVEGHKHAIKEKAEIMVDHFHQQVIARNKVGGDARAMVVTNSIRRAIDYYHAISSYLEKRKSPFKAIVAFSGEHEVAGKKVSESVLNGFPSVKIEDNFKKDPYRFLICADKFQTGYDEPLLHTMYVDKALSGIKAVQTLSRLNRAHPKKHDTFILDFLNETDDIQSSFEEFYRSTILSESTDPNRLHDLKSDLDSSHVYNQEQVDSFVEKYLSGVARDKLDPILDTCVVRYLEDLEENGQVEFKSKAKAFVRSYGFLASILPFTNANWEKLATFLNFLVSKLPAPTEEDLSRGILESIDMDSYRVEVQSSLNIALVDADAEIAPVPTAAGGGRSEPELDTLSNILRSFNDLFGNIDWKDEDKIRNMISKEIPNKVSADKAYQNAIQNSDKQNARLEHDKALGRVITELLTDQAELFKQFSDNPSFKKWLADTIFSATYKSDDGE